MPGSRGAQGGLGDRKTRRSAVKIAGKGGFGLSDGPCASAGGRESGGFGVLGN